MRLQLLVSALMITMFLASVTGHAANNDCGDQTNATARQICEELKVESAAAAKMGDFSVFGESRKRLGEMKDSLRLAYLHSQSPNVDLNKLKSEYEDYRSRREAVKADLPLLYSRTMGKTKSAQVADPGTRQATAERDEKIGQAFEKEKFDQEFKKRQELAFQAEEENKKLLETVQTAQKKIAEKKAADAAAKNAAGGALQADREQMKDSAEVPRCFSSGFPVGTAEKVKSRCERISNSDGMLKAMKIKEAKGLENLKSCSGGQLLCNPFTFGARKTASGAEPICVKASKNATAECEKRSGQKERDFRKEILGDEKNMAALKGLHKNLENSCGINEQQKNAGVSSNDVLRVGRSLSSQAQARVDNADFLQTCQRMLTITSTLVNEKAGSSSVVASPSSPASARPVGAR